MNSPMSRLLSDFECPPSELRAAPFWAWNGRLDEKELRRQIGIFHQMGFGGFFMHSRTGLDTPYLSKKWFDCVGICIEEAKKYGMKACLYDEDRWPSGSAGGLVTIRPEFRARLLCCETLADPADYTPCANTLVCCAVRFADAREKRIAEMRTLDLENPVFPAGKDWKVLHFFIEMQKETTWHNNQTYLDVLNADAVDEFLRVTYEKYARACGAEFGRAVPVIFSDEPHWSSLNQEDGPGMRTSAWTVKLPELFRERFSYDILEHLPELFFEVEGVPCATVFYDYSELLTTLFVESYSKRIGRWCGEHGIEFTGHMLFEDDPVLQLAYGGGLYAIL